jgi:hypothetical protein
VDEDQAIGQLISCETVQLIDEDVVAIPETVPDFVPPAEYFGVQTDKRTYVYPAILNMEDNLTPGSVAYVLKAVRYKIFLWNFVFKCYASNM